MRVSQLRQISKRQSRPAQLLASDWFAWDGQPQPSALGYAPSRAKYQALAGSLSVSWVTTRMRVSQPPSQNKATRNRLRSCRLRCSPHGLPRQEHSQADAIHKVRLWLARLVLKRATTGCHGRLARNVVPVFPGHKCHERTRAHVAKALRHTAVTSSWARGRPAVKKRVGMGPLRRRRGIRAVRRRRGTRAVTKHKGTRAVKRHRGARAVKRRKDTRAVKRHTATRAVKRPAGVEAVKKEDSAAFRQSSSCAAGEQSNDMAAPRQSTNIARRVESKRGAWGAQRQSRRRAVKASARVSRNIAAPGQPKDHSSRQRRTRACVPKNIAARGQSPKT